MIKKSVLLSALAIAGFAVTSLAQTVPNYVPTNGLVGWWPFNGNATDESVNTNDGMVNGPTLTTDRFGNANNAYSFDGVNDWINVANSNSLNPPLKITISAWINTFGYNASNAEMIVNKGWDQGPGHYDLLVFSPNYKTRFVIGSNIFVESSSIINLNQWKFITATIDSLTMKIYSNGILENTIVQSTNNFFGANTDPLYIGKHDYNNAPYYFYGKIDDIGIWNRALTQQEITDLYNACSATFIVSQPTNQTLLSGTNAIFTVSATAGASLQWQTNLGTGFQNLSNAGQYSGVNTQTLTISTIAANNNNQTFRCLVGSGLCSDTSNVVTLILSPVGLEELTLLKNVEVYPNPAVTQLHIKSAIKFSSLKIMNNVGQLVLSKDACQAIDVSSLSNGIYFIKLYDEKGQLLTVKKFVKE